jgi:two-component system, NtrC family, response regulator AtoC
MSALTGLTILLLEDDVMQSKRLGAQLERLGADVVSAGSLQAARQLLAGMDFDFALMDVNLPDGVALDLLREKIIPANTGVIMMTAHGGIAGAVEAMQLGALDYLAKPFEAAELPLAIERARRRRQTARVEERRRDDVAQEAIYFGSALVSLRQHLEKILAADRRMDGPLPPVLIQGETGTGKTTIARWIHQNGPRAGQQLVEVNCSALPETLAESELFGHERGAFTDARQARMGLFEAADGGTLFLDELPSLSLPLQAKVLTAIEDRRIRRVGGNKSLPVDARVIAATNCDLRELAARKLFREDLFHRLDLYRIALPPLRERGEDILKLAELFVRRLCRKHRLPLKTFSPEARQRLLAFPWPGNVRELSHELERAVVFEEGSVLSFAHLGGANAEREGKPDWLNPEFRFGADEFTLDSATNRFIDIALRQTDGNISAAARLLGVPHDFIRYRLGRKKKKTD